MLTTALPLMLFTLSGPSSARAAAPAGIEGEVLQVRGQDSPSCFDYAQVDLNGDEIDELVIVARDGNWCASGGCTAFVFTRSRERLALAGRITLVGRLSIDRSRSHGWRNLVVQDRYGTFLLKFDGQKYPLNPTVAPAHRIAKPASSVELAWRRSAPCK